MHTSRAAQRTLSNVHATRRSTATPSRHTTHQPAGAALPISVSEYSRNTLFMETMLVFLRQVGHDRWSRTHPRTQVSWKTCPHPLRITGLLQLSLTSPNSEKHIEHSTPKHFFVVVVDDADNAIPTEKNGSTDGDQCSMTTKTAQGGLVNHSITGRSMV